MTTDLHARLLVVAERIDKVFDHGRLATQEWQILVQAIQALREAAAEITSIRQSRARIAALAKEVIEHADNEFVSLGYDEIDVARPFLRAALAEIEKEIS